MKSKLRNRLHLSRLKALFNLIFLFLESPRQFLSHINRDTIASFFSNFGRMHPAAFENKIRRKFESYPFSISESYFHILAIPKKSKNVLIIGCFQPTNEKNMILADANVKKVCTAIITPQSIA